MCFYRPIRGPSSQWCISLSNTCFACLEWSVQMQKMTQSIHILCSLASHSFECAFVWKFRSPVSMCKLITRTISDIPSAVSVCPSNTLFPRTRSVRNAGNIVCWLAWSYSCEYECILSPLEVTVRKECRSNFVWNFDLAGPATKFQCNVLHPLGNTYPWGCMLRGGGGEGGDTYNCERHITVTLVLFRRSTTALKKGVNKKWPSTGDANLSPSNYHFMRWYGVEERTEDIFAPIPSLRPFYGK